MSMHSGYIFGRTVAWFLTGVVFSSIGCAGPHLVFQSRSKAPLKKVRSAFVDAGRKHYSNWSFGAADTADDAHGLAFMNGLSAALSELGVTVTGTQESVQVEENGEYRYRISSRTKTKQVPLELNGIKVEDRYEECLREGGGRRCNAFVRLSIPLDELKAAARRIRGKVAFVWLCESDGEATCTPAIEEEIRSASSRAGLRLIDTTTRVEKAPEELGDELDAAFVLKVNMSARMIGQEDDAFYARGSASARLVETRDGKVLATADTGEMKAGGYTRADAVRLTLKDVCSDLGARIRSGAFKEVAGPQR